MQKKNYECLEQKHFVSIVLYRIFKKIVADLQMIEMPALCAFFTSLGTDSLDFY